VLQILEITDRVVVALNLMDEAKRHGLDVDHRRLARDLGVRVVPTSARYNQGLDELLEALHEVATGKAKTKPYRIKADSPELNKALTSLVDQILEVYPDLPNPRWVALRLLDGDDEIIKAVQDGSLGELTKFEEPELEAA
jgi:ferrous iron transport protein B